MLGRVKVLIIQGAGMNMRGKVDVEIFGPMTLEQLNDKIRGYAEQLGIDVEFCQSNIEGDMVNALSRWPGEAGTLADGSHR